MPQNKTKLKSTTDDTPKRGLFRRAHKPSKHDIIGPRVVLRRPKMRDFKAWSGLRAENYDYLQPREPAWVPDELTKPAFRARVRSYQTDARYGLGYAYFIWDKQEDELLGAITLGHVRRGAAQMATLGYWIGEQFAGRGLMSEAVALLVDFAFSHLGLHRLEAACMIDNERSIGVLENCGFKNEGYAQKYLKINGRWEDHALYALCRDDITH